MTTRVGRRNLAFMERLSGSTVIQQYFLDGVGTRKDSTKISQYCKIFPWERAFDEAGLRKMLGDNKGFSLMLLVRTLPGGVDPLVAVAKE
jgi:hypothetical protein